MLCITSFRYEEKISELFKSLQKKEGKYLYNFFKKLLQLTRSCGIN